MFITPRPGISLRDPVLRDLIPAEGREVESSQYWQRRVMDGDATVGVEQKDSKIAVKTTAEKNNQRSES